ncbi:6551_t:CDS:2 [Funneliformis geosporum]|nr:6551_t:CDS:2 [Funneliformis geosporum]
MKAKVAGRKTNVMIDTDTVRNAVSKSFLDEIGLEIDEPPDRTLIGISCASQCKNRLLPKKAILSTKLEAKWIGLYFIYEVYEKSNYKLRTLEGKLLKNSVHENRFKMYYEETLEPWVIIEEFLPEKEN